MKLRLTVFIFLLLLACQITTPVPPPTATPISTATPTTTPTSTPTPAPTPTLILPTLVPTLDLAPGDFDVRLHPDGGLFPGDQISFEVIAPPEAQLDQQEVQIATEDGIILGTAGFGGFGIGDRQQATLQWVWDTTGLPEGAHTLSFSVVPDGFTFTETITLLPESLRPYPEPNAVWALGESDCCLFYYVTGTAAERDLAMLMDTADAEAVSTIAQLGGEFTEPITIVFLPRVLGHGGFAGGEVYISYLDRNYAGNSPAQVIHHEMVHILDGRKGGDFRPSIFGEGLAVFLSGGHFKQEDVVARVAATLGLDYYIPLSGLSDDFYNAQHEVSYAEGAALIQFMTETWGWEAFETFYRSIQQHPSNLPSAAINQALQVHFSITFDELETQFTAWLAAQPADPAAAEDIRLTVLFFETVRRYQQALDPSAYFLTAWLLGIGEMTERGIVADYLRHPTAAENIALETLLVNADKALRAGDYPAAERALAAVNAVLDGFAASNTSPFHADPLAGDHYAIVLALLEQGYDPQEIAVDGQTARVLATLNSTELLEIGMVREAEGWTVAN